MSRNHCAPPSPNPLAWQPVAGLGRNVHAVLTNAYIACRRGKRRARNTMAYEARCLDRLIETRDALNDRTWRPSRTLAFVVDQPKTREIHAADLQRHAWARSAFTFDASRWRLVNRFEPSLVASYAGQKRWFARRFPDCALLVQKGWEYELVGGAVDPRNGGSAAKAALARCLPAANLARLVAALRRAGRAYVIVREEGYLKLGRKRRVLSEIGWPAASQASPQSRISLRKLHPCQESVMYRNLLALAALLAVQATALEAGAACTAGNPNAGAIESTPTSAFTNHGNGTLTHNLTGLMWKQCAQGLSGAGCATGTATTMNWSGALAAAVADTTAGHGDWRLPNPRELESIVEFCGYNPAINQTLFPATPASSFWSGSSYVPVPSIAWYVGFYDGYATYSNKSSGFQVRLVRGGQSFGSFDANHPLSTLDIDGNGTADALTDGLLVIRYLFGLRGAALIQGAVGAGAQRMSAAEIEAYIQSILP